jgi:hypothetical protein
VEGASCGEEGKTLLAVADLSGARLIGVSFRAEVIVAGGTILQTPEDGRSATHLGNLDALISGRIWIFDETRCIL